ncbi:FG-nucleoporin NUP116 Ecym_2290 [Eremothecium cymbalariae DBVPG|uniref:Peptidase S59 domain-containing protein n=1 Tax=Eremothecium cymbalariae (strain CBS 270.75 / DBVPG 7215 / KCTC 17166 / NRRL Y-17582) TaxID=931890 RepID=G8JPS8_ERECY|nr:Hypothetical protein Ecym_2290 [Eremothecium cymbalariae DBVPG\
MFGVSRPTFGNTGASPFGQQQTGTFGQPQSTTNAFGSNTTNNAQSGFGGFGNTQQQATPSPFGMSQQQQSNNGPFGQATSSVSNPPSLFNGNAGGQAAAGGTGIKPFSAYTEKDATTGVNNAFQSISCMPEYKNYSFEELRFQDYKANNKYGQGGTGAGGNVASSFGAQSNSSPFGTNNQASFGVGNANASSTGGFFGQANTNTASSPFNQNTTSNAFGQATANSPFVQTSTNAFGQGAAGASSSPFGQGNAAANSPFGLKTATTTGAGGGGGLFGQNNTSATFGQNATTSGGLFGQSGNANNASPFGQSSTFNQAANTSAGGLFGQNNNQQQQQPGSMFASSNNQQSGGLFGQNNTQQQSTGLFGNANSATATFGQSNTSGLFNKPTTAGGLFGQSGTQPQQQGGGLFGQNNTNTVFGQGNPSSGGLFGQTQQAQPPQAGGPSGAGAGAGAGIFGQNTQQGSLFGQSNNTQQPQQQQQQPQQGGLFVQNGQQQQGGLFGQNSGSNSFRQTSNAAAGGIFGSKPPATGGLFGQNTVGGNRFGQPTTNNTNTGGLFGQNNAQQQSGGMFGSNNTQQPSGGLFGQNSNAQQQPGSGLFGQNNNTQQLGGGLFGQNNNQQQGGGMFGSKPTGTSTGGLFSGGNNAPAAGGLFGNNNQQQQQQQQGGGLFGNNTAQSGAIAGGLFGNKTLNNNTGAGLFGNNSSSQTNNTGVGLFGSTNNVNANSNSGSGGLFTPKPLNASSSSATGSLFGSKPSGTSTVGATGGGLFSSKPGVATSSGLFGPKAPGSTTNGLFGNTNSSSTGSNIANLQQPVGNSVSSAQQGNNPYGTNELFSRVIIPNSFTQPSKPSATKINADNKKKASLTSAYRLAPKPLFSPKSKANGTAARSGNNIMSRKVSSMSSSQESTRELVPTSTGSSTVFTNETDEIILSSTNRLFNPDKKSFKNLILNRKKMEDAAGVGNDGNEEPKRITFAPALASEKETSQSKESNFFETVHDTPAAAKENKKPSYIFNGTNLPIMQANTAVEEKKDIVKPSGFVGDDLSFIEDGYYISPSLETLSSMTLLQLRKVSGLVVGQNDYGKIEFLAPVDLSNISLPTICGNLVRFAEKVCEVSYVGNIAPPPGDQLNVRARITLHSTYPTDKATRQPIKDPKHPILKRHIEKLKKIEHTKFESYDVKTGSYIFIVETPVA